MTATSAGEPFWCDSRSMKSCTASTLDEASRFWVPDADEKLQALIDGADDRNDLIRIVREIDFWLANLTVDSAG